MTFFAAQSEPNRSRAGTHPNLPATRALSLAIFAVVLLLNLLLLARNYYWDGVFFAQVIEDARSANSSLIHPSHLFDQLFEYFIYRAVLAAGFHARALTVIQITNCFLSAGAAVLFFKICRQLFKSTYASLVLAAVFAFSATWWKFSTDADAYVLAVFLLLACFYFLLPGRRPRPFVVALIHVGALLIHQLSVFFFPAAIVGIVLQSRAQNPRRCASNVAKYAVSVTMITLVVYYMSFHFATGSWSLAQFISWSTYFSPEHGFTFSASGNFVFSIRSQWRTFLGGRVAFIREFASVWVYLLAGFTAALTLSFLYQAFRHVAELRGTIAAALVRFRSLILLCLAWTIPYLMFLFFFIPQNVFYRLFYFPAVVLLLGGSLSAAESQPNHVRRYRAALFAAAFFAANLTFSQYPYSQTRANPPLQLAMKLNRAWRPGTTIYFAEMTSDNSLVKYFNPSTVWIEAKSKTLDEIAASSTDQSQVWLDSTLIEQIAATAEGRQWLAAHVIEIPDYQLVNPKYRIRFGQIKR